MDARVERGATPALQPERVREAATALTEHFRETPAFQSPLLSDLLGADVFVKCEFMSPIGSFKARGALYALLRAKERGPLAGAVTSSTGNHGQGVAYAARLLGVPAYIFLPRDPNPEKRAMIERLGASVGIDGDDIDEAKDVARSFAADGHLTFVDDGECDDVIYGAGTVGLELSRQAGRFDYCFVPMGSGTLASGVGMAFQLAGDSTRVIAVQSSEAPAMVESYHARRPVDRPIRTLAEGLACRVPPQLALSGLLSFVDGAIATSDQQLLSCMGLLLRSAHLLVEPAGAAALAGAMAMKQAIAGTRVALVLTGANTTADMIQRALSVEVGSGTP